MREGDIVARKSYGKDIIFKIEKITIDEHGKKVAILKGIAFRIIADAPLNDLEQMKVPDIYEVLVNRDVENLLYRYKILIKFYLWVRLFVMLCQRRD